jgi:hypothetical protein
LKLNNPGYKPTTGEAIETSIELNAKPAEEETDYEIELIKNQNRIYSLWNEIVQ